METELIAPVGLFICSLVISTRIEISVVIYWDIKISSSSSSSEGDSED